MLLLADLQRNIHGSLLTREPQKVPVRDVPIKGALSLSEALSIHRGTAIGGLVNALRLTHPTIDALVGEDYFDHVARAYVLSHPPRHAHLDIYGAAFAAFVESFPSAQGLSYLADVARLDWAVDRALHRSGAMRTITIDAQVAIRLPTSMAVLELSYPAHIIRESLGNDAALAAINLEASSHYIAIWRQNDAAAVLAIRPAAGRFLTALVEGAAPDQALRRAGTDPAQTLPIIQTDVFAASFCAVTSLTEETI
jgi:hypothetical protein